MKTTFKPAAILFLLISIFNFSCKHDKNNEVTPTAIVNASIDQNKDTTAFVGTAEQFTLTFTTTESNPSYKLLVSGLNGSLVIGSTSYSDNMVLQPGVYIVKYTPNAAGNQTLTFNISNGSITRTATAKYIVYTPYTVTYSNTVFTGTTASLIDFSLTINSSNPNTKYYLNYSTDGALDIYFNATSPFVKNSEVSSSFVNNLKIKIPGGHPAGTYHLTIVITDSDGQQKSQVLTVVVQ